MLSVRWENPARTAARNLSALDVDLWNEKNEDLKRRVMQRTAIMFQRTFALYGDDRVIENVLHALDDINYPPEKAIAGRQISSTRSGSPTA